MSRAHLNAVLAAALGVAAVGCADDPQYVQPQQAIEVGAPGSDVQVAVASIDLPIRLETEDEATERGELAAQLGVMVPYVRVGDLSISVEWTLKNLSDEEAQARVMVNAGNEMFNFVPSAFVIDPEEDEEPPPLIGGIPVMVPAGGTLNGVFREDELREGAIDLELITRGATNPFAAILQTHEDITEFVDPAGGPAIPAEAFASIVRFNVELRSNRHMVLEYTVRVRDHRGILHEELLFAPAEELTVFSPADFTPPPPPAT